MSNVPVYPSAPVGPPIEPIYVTRTAAEALFLRDNDYQTRITRTAAEALFQRDDDYQTRVTRVAVEVLFQNP